MGEMTIEINDENFQEEIVNSKKPVLIDFWAAWCGPCRIMSPLIDEIAEEYKDKIKVGKINVDDNQELASKYEILSIPTFIIFEKGEPAKKFIGSLPKKKLLEELEPYL